MSTHIGIKHKKKTAELLQCLQCKNKFKNSKALSTHIGIKHGKKLICSKCKITFRRPNELEQHIKQRHSQSPTNLSQCLTCKQTHATPHALSIHIGMCHKTLNQEFDPNFDFTTAVQLPSWRDIQQYRLDNIDYNAAGFLKMIGNNIADPRKQPKLQFQINKDEIINNWKQNMRHNIPIKICGTCGRQVIETQGQYHMISINSKKLQIFKVDETKDVLPPKNSIKYQHLHLTEMPNGDIYKVCQQAVYNDKIGICNVCNTKLSYKKSKEIAPKHTFAHYDLGKANSNLKKLTFAEKLAISKVIPFCPTIQYKPVYGKRNIGIKGHAFGIKTSQKDVWDSVVNVLPRLDLGDVIHVNLCAKKEMFAIAKQIIKQGPLHIRADVILEWLQWFKALGNPYYHDVTIRTHSETEKIIKDSINKILNNASESESAKIHGLMDRSRTELLDEQEGLNDNINENTCILRNAFITTESPTEAPLLSVMKQIQQKLLLNPVDDEPQEKIIFNKNIDSDLVNEYQKNPYLFSMAFPHIFPHGLSEKVWGTASVPKDIKETWMLFYDHRCAEEHNLMFLLFDQQKRHATNNAVSYKIKAGGDREQTFIDAVNADDFAENLQYALEHPNSRASKSIRQAISPLVKIVGRTLPWTPFERSDTLGKLFSLTHFFGVATHFITLSPSMRANKIALRMCINDNSEEFKLPTITARTQMIINNPIAATHTFYHLIDKFFKVIVRLPLDSFTGRNINFDELIKKEVNQTHGAYGDITAHYGVIEEQTGGNLHYHGMLFGAWDIRAFQQWCHDGSAAKMFQAIVDAHITCEIPDKYKVEKNKPKLDEMIMQPYPDATMIDEEGRKLASILNHHKHSSTCYKGGYKQCRFGLPQPQSLETIFTEIYEDENGNVMRKEHISEPPLRGNNAFSNEDSRIIVGRLVRKDVFEEMQVECNTITTALVRCNTSMQMLMASTQSKTAAFYMANYMSKQPYPLQNIIPVIYQADKEHKIYGSTATDAGCRSRKAKNLLQKIINKHGILEISDQQAAAAVLGYDSFLSSHKFAFVEPRKAIAKLHELQHELNDIDEIDDSDDDDDEIELANLEVESETKKAISISSLDRYINRGQALSKYSLYMYTLMIGHRIPLKKKSNNPQHGGRRDNPTFPFEKNSKPAKCFEQIMKSCPTIPRISGKRPPAYPGDKPSEDESNKNMKSWIKAAKHFVEFYSLLFLPFDANLNLLAPYESILPWTELTSWDNFWITFNQFENADNFYHRAIWFIFHNMVDNMRQTTTVKKTVAKWRFAKAHVTTEDAEQHQNDIIDEIANAGDEQFNDVDYDELAIIIDKIRDQHGPDRFLSSSEKSRKDAMEFVQNQIRTFVTIQQDDLRKVDVPKKFNIFTYQDCKVIAQNMLLSHEELDEEQDSKMISISYSDSSIIEVNIQKEIKLKDFQQKAVQKLKQIKMENEGNDELKPQQLLAFIQGIPGAGKTTTAKKLAEKLGLNVLYSGTTGTAAAQLKSETINKILKLGRNISVIKKLKFTASKKKHIIETFENVQVLIIDEVSMLTPVTLARINIYLQKSLENKFLFGGLDVILIGDMFQFPPIQPGLAKPALYQAAVMLGLGLTPPNEDYRRGAILFTKFRLVILDGQVRASPEFNKWLAKLRNLNVNYPVTDDWLSQLQTLNAKDFQDENINWNEATIVVSGNLERYNFIATKIKIFAMQQQQPILRWTCPVETKKHQYKTLDHEVEYAYPHLIKYFVPGAKCILTESLATQLGIGKGTDGTFVSLGWKNAEDIIDFKKLQIGEITTITQPDYLVIDVQITSTETKRVAIKPQSTKYKVSKQVTMKYLAHECELSASVTFHKMQGKTSNSLILSLNSIPKISKKIHPVSISSLYVGCSRVHDHDHLRILPISKKVKEHLKTLQWDPYLKLFFKNFDKEGRWKPNGLKHEREKIIASNRRALGLIDLDDMTLIELTQFARDLDVIVTHKDKDKDEDKKPHYIEALKSHHVEGVKLLDADDGYYRKQATIYWIQQLQTQNIDNIKLGKLRYYAKRLGIKKTAISSTKTLRIKLKKLLKHKDAIDINQSEKQYNILQDGDVMKEKMLMDDDADSEEDVDMQDIQSHMADISISNHNTVNNIFVPDNYTAKTALDDLQRQQQRAKECDNENDYTIDVDDEGWGKSIDDDWAGNDEDIDLMPEKH